MHAKTLTELSHLLSTKAVSSRELVDYFIDRIERFNPELNAFISIFAERARNDATSADKQLAAGTASPLTGLPIAHKDLFCTQNEPMTCGAKMLESFISPYESTVTGLLKKQGMISLGKTNMDEFAMGSSGETSHFGPCLNPWQLDRVPGGSSGGSAAAVAARLVPATTASDTGGSIRQPASFCGVTGIKPTYGRVSRWGMTAYASSLDQGGIMATSAEDCAVLLEQIAGFDPKDSTSVNRPVPTYRKQLNSSLKELKIGLPDQYFSAELDPALRDHILTGVVSELEKSFNIEFVPVSLPHTEVAAAAYCVIAPAEASSNMARFDGVRFGYRCADPHDLQDMYERSRQEAFGAEVKRRILVGTYALSEKCYNDYYLKAQKIRQLVANDFTSVFNQVDLLLTPVSPTAAFALDSKNKDPLSMYMTDIYTIPANLAGLPAMTLPAGLINNLPVGVQLIGNHFDEGRLLNVAHQYQSMTKWHQMLPQGY